MGKKSRKPSSPPPIKEAPKHEIKPMKFLRPKVYITDSSSFKALVQELTGNGKYSALPPPTSVPEVAWEVPYLETYQDFGHDLVYQESMMISGSVDVSSDFAASVEASPANGTEVEERQRLEFYKGLEAMMMEMDSDYSSDYAHIFQQDEVCVYDYDLSNFV